MQSQKLWNSLVFSFSLLVFSFDADGSPAVLGWLFLPRILRIDDIGIIFWVLHWE
jgi:hypothetical protein